MLFDFFSNRESKMFLLNIGIQDLKIQQGQDTVTHRVNSLNKIRLFQNPGPLSPQTNN